MNKPNNLARFPINLDRPDGSTVSEDLYNATQDVMEMVTLIKDQNDKVSTMQAICMLSTAVQLMEYRK